MRDFQSNMHYRSRLNLLALQIRWYTCTKLVYIVLYNAPVLCMFFSALRPNLSAFLLRRYIRTICINITFFCYLYVLCMSVSPPSFAPLIILPLLTSIIKPTILLIVRKQFTEISRSPRMLILIYVLIIMFFSSSKKKYHGWR